MKILFDSTNHNPETPILLNKAGHEVFIPKQDIPDIHTFDLSSFLATLKSVQPDILVVGSFKFQIDKEIIDLVGKAIFARMTAVDSIDTKYCKEKRIEVFSLRGEDLSDITATAEWTFLNMGMLLRKTGHELNSKTLGVIGFGRLGKMMEQYGLAFGMKVLKYDTNFVETENQSNAGLLEVVLSCSDIVSLHITANESNKNFMDKEKFSEMKQGSWFLNSARDWLVDSSALAWARENRLAGDWSDFPEHQGGSTIQSAQKTESIIVSKLINYAKNSLSNL